MSSVTGLSLKIRFRLTRRVASLDGNPLAQKKIHHVSNIHVQYVHFTIKSKNDIFSRINILTAPLLAFSTSTSKLPVLTTCDVKKLVMNWIFFSRGPSGLVLPKFQLL